MKARILRSVEGAAPWAVVALMLAIAVSGMVPPTVAPRDANPVDFSAQRALDHVAAIAVAPRPIGSDATAAARSYVIEQFEALGLEPITQEFLVRDYYGSDAEVPIVNLYAVIPGTDATGGIALIGHLDTVPTTPGANDDAAAVATVLEAGRAILAGPQLRNDVLLLITDGEEPAPRFGSTVFAEHADGVGLVINFEAIGGSGPSHLIEVVGDEMTIVGAYANAVPRPVATSVLDDFAELLGGSNTDIAPFRHLGVPGLEFAYLLGSPIYHTPDDDVGSVHPGSLQHHGSHAVSLVAGFGDTDLTDLRGDDQAVFFSIAGRTVVLYSAWFGVVTAALVFALVLVTLWIEVRSRRLTVRQVVDGAGWHALIALGAGIMLAIVWRLLVIVLWADSGPVGVSATAWWAAMACGAIGLTLMGVRWLALRRDLRVVAWGGLLFWSILGLALAYEIPGAAYLFVWPALAALVVTVRRSEAAWARLGALAVVGFPVIVLTLPVLDVFFQFAQPRPGNPDSQLPEIILLFGLVISLTTMLLMPHLEQARRPAERRVEN